MSAKTYAELIVIAAFAAAGLILIAKDWVFVGIAMLFVVAIGVAG